MLMRIINDIKQALENDCVIAALVLALTLPDICGKAKYPNEKVGKRYIDWYNEYVGVTEKCPLKPGGIDMPYLSGEVVYSLRNCMLHQGTPNIETTKIQEECCKIDRFNLIIEKKNKYDCYGDSCDVDASVCPNGEKAIYGRTYNLSVRRLCLILYLCAEGYYNENKAQFNFFDFNINFFDFNIIDRQNAYTEEEFIVTFS